MLMMAAFLPSDSEDEFEGESVGDLQSFDGSIGSEDTDFDPDNVSVVESDDDLRHYRQ